MKLFRMFLCYTLIVLLLFPHSALAAGSDRVAVVKDVRGDVFIKKGGGGREFAAVNNMSLSQGDSVRTGKNGSANIVYDNGTKATVGASSKVMITKLSNDEGEQSKVKVWTGKLWNSVQNLLNVNDEYDVETPTAVMGVRGTHFLVETDPVTGQTTLSVLDGRVGIQEADREEGDSPDNDNDEERLVSTNEVIQVDSIEETNSEKETVNTKGLVEKLDSVILVEMIRDLTEAIERKQEEATKVMEQYEVTNEVKLIEQSVQLAKVAKSISVIQENMIKEAKKTEKKEEINKLLLERANENLNQFEEKVEKLKEKSSKLEEKVLSEAKDAGISEEEIKANTPESIKHLEEKENASVEEQEEDNAWEDDDDDDSPATPALKPLGSPVAVNTSKPFIKFSNGLTLDVSHVDFGSNQNVTVTVTEVSQPVIPANSAMVKAGMAVDVDFNVELPEGAAIKLQLPVNSTADASKVGIFYLNEETNQWEYQPTHVENGVATTTVSHFSIYGVFEANEVSLPVASISSGKEVAVGTEISLTTETNGARIYYTIDGSMPTEDSLVYSETHKPVIMSGNNVIMAVAIKDNMRQSYIVMYEYTGAALKTVDLAWVNAGGMLTTEPMSFQAVARTAEEVSVNVKAGSGILNGSKSSETVAILLKVPAGMAPAIDTVYRSVDVDGSWIMKQHAWSYTNTDTYYVIEEGLLVDSTTNITIPFDILFNSSGTFSGVEVIAVPENTSGDLFLITPGVEYDAFNIETRGELSSDIGFDLILEDPVTYGDFQYELLRIESDGVPIPGHISLNKTGNSFWVDFTTNTSYDIPPIAEIRISGMPGTKVEGMEHTLVIEDIGDFRNVIQIDNLDNYVPGIMFPEIG